MNTPMKDSGIPWIGLIPEHWGIRRIKFLFKERSEKGFPDEPVLCATQKYGVIPQSIYENRVVAVNKGLEGLKLVKEGDFVISLRSFQGGIEYAHYQGIISAAYTVLIPSDEVNPNYIKHLFKSHSFIELLQTCVTGIREGQNINYDLLRTNDIPLPPLPEQEAIADFLDEKCREVDTMVDIQVQFIEQLKAYKQSLIAETVTHGLNPTAPRKDSHIDWIGLIPQHWEVKRLKDVCCQNLEVLSEKESYKLEFDYVDIGSISFEKGIFNTEHYKFGDAPSRARRRAKYGDLVISTVRTYLRAIDVIDTEEKASYIYSTGFAILTPMHNIEYRFLSYISKSPYFLEQVTALSRGINYPSINSTDLMTIAISHPPLPEQEAIADFLDRKCSEIDQIIALKQQKINALHEYKKSIIYEYVTGKRNING